MAAHSRARRPPIPVIILVLALLVGGGGWWWWTSSQASADAGDQLSGTVETTEYQISPALSGRITKVGVVEGDTVTKGQELVRLDRSALNLQLRQARQGVTAARAAVTNARNDDDATRADVAAAKARLAQAEAAVKLAEVQLGYTIVTAPRDGTVISVIANTGQNAAPGRTLLTIADSSQAFVRVFVPETEIGNVHLGQAARLRTDSRPDPWDGTVSFIASSAQFTPNNVQTRDQRVKLVFEVRVRVTDSSGTLKAGLPVDVALG